MQLKQEALHGFLLAYCYYSIKMIHNSVIRILLQVPILTRKFILQYYSTNEFMHMHANACIKIKFQSIIMQLKGSGKQGQKDAFIFSRKKIAPTHARNYFAHINCAQ